MDRFDDDTLAAELRALRPRPRPEFTAALDERAAAGFPRRSTPSAAAMPFALLVDRWHAMTPRRRLTPVLAVALAALVVATAVVALSQSGRQSHAVEDNLLGSVESGEPSGGSGVYAEESATAGTASPHHRHGTKQTPNHSHPGGAGRGGSETSGEAVYESEIPSVTSQPAEGGTSGGEESGGGGEAGNAGHAAVPPAFSPSLPGPKSSATGHRDIERSAYVVLGTRPGEVSAAATKVYEAVHAADGIVLHSSVQSGKTGATGATFALLIPSSKLSGALAAFSSIAEVRERHDATNDITEPTVGDAEELADSNAAIEGLLKELGNAETEAERESAEARLREERRRHAAIRASLDHLHERAAMSEVSVRIVTDHGAGVTPGGSGSGNWSVGDALRDAGKILTIAAGIVLIALAILAPIALIALLAWLVNRFRVRRLRERTLG